MDSLSRARNSDAVRMHFLSLARDSDVPVGYGGYTNYPQPGSLRFNKSMMTNWARENNRFSAWMSSNCYDYNRRQLLIAELKVCGLVISELSDFYQIYVIEIVISKVIKC